ATWSSPAALYASVGGGGPAGGMLAQPLQQSGPLAVSVMGAARGVTSTSNGGAPGGGLRPPTSNAGSIMPRASSATTMGAVCGGAGGGGALAGSMPLLPQAMTTSLIQIPQLRK
ncbi:hypothetical protein Vafri_10763, partial [Volvox africanus]